MLLGGRGLFGAGLLDLLLVGPRGFVGSRLLILLLLGVRGLFGTGLLGLLLVSRLCCTEVAGSMDGISLFIAYAIRT